MFLFWRAQFTTDEARRCDAPSIRIKKVSILEEPKPDINMAPAAAAMGGGDAPTGIVAIAKKFCLTGASSMMAEVRDSTTSEYICFRVNA